MAEYGFKAIDEHERERSVIVNANGKKHAYAKAVMRANELGLKIIDKDNFSRYGKNRNGRPRTISTANRGW